MENVRGITIGKQKQVLERIIKRFQAAGYQVTTKPKVLNAAHYGVPQSRQRLFLMGCRQGLNLPSYPQAITHPLTKSAPQDLLPTPTVVEAIGDLPEVNHYPELEFRDWVVAKYGQPREYANRLRNPSLVADNYAYGRQCNPSILTCSRRTRHTSQTIERFANTVPGQSDRISHFRRLAWDGQCITLRAGTASNRGAFTSPRPIHPHTPRCITVREAARLHSYPDWFMFHATKWHGFRQIGNSVPPLLAQAIAREVIGALGLKPVKPQQQFDLEQSEQSELLQFKMTQAEKYHDLPARAIARRTIVKSNARSR